MLGAIAGDIIGSVYENFRTKSKAFRLLSPISFFTDDTVLTCQGSVPEAIIAFLDSTDFEDAIRNAVSLGGDADTQAAIAGAIAEAHYNGVPEHILKIIWRKMPAGYRKVVISFSEKYGTARMAEQSIHAGQWMK